MKNIKVSSKVWKQLLALKKQKEYTNYSQALEYLLSIHQGITEPNEREQLVQHVVCELEKRGIL